MGYTVSVYDNNGREIDFIAEKDGKRYFVQAACSLAGGKGISEGVLSFREYMPDRQQDHHNQRRYRLLHECRKAYQAEGFSADE